MTDSTISNSTYGSHFDLQRRILLRVQSTGVDAQILEVFRRVFADALQTEGVDITRSEKERLLKQIAELLFDEIVRGLDSDLKLEK